MKNEFLTKLDAAFRVMTFEDLTALTRVVDKLKASEDYLVYLRVLSYLAFKGSGIYRTEEIFGEINRKDKRGEGFPSMPYIDSILFWLKQEKFISYPPRPSENLPFDVNVGPLCYTWGFHKEDYEGNKFLNCLAESFSVMTFRDWGALKRVDEFVKDCRDHLLLIRTLVYLAARGNGDCTRQEMLSGVSTMRDAHRERFPSLFSIEALLTTLKSKKFIDFPVRQTSDEPYAINVDPLFQTWGFPDNGKEGEVSNG